MLCLPERLGLCRSDLPQSRYVGLCTSGLPPAAVSLLTGAVRAVFLAVFLSSLLGETAILFAYPFSLVVASLAFAWCLTSIILQLSSVEAPDALAALLVVLLLAETLLLQLLLLEKNFSLNPL